MLTVLPWISLLLVLWIFVLWRLRKYNKLIQSLPGSIGYPGVGILSKFFTKPIVLDVFENGINKFGTIWLGWMSPTPVLVVSDPQITQEILSSPNAVNKSRWGYNGIQHITGDGLVTIKEPLWSKHRKTLNPAFGHNLLLSFLPIFNEETRTLLLDLDMLGGMGENILLSHLKNLNLRIAARTTMNYNIKTEQVYRNNTLLQSYDHITEIGSQMATSPWLGNKMMRSIFGIEKDLKDSDSTIRQLIKKFINSAPETDHPARKESKSFISLAILHFKSKQSVEAECHTIIMAAFETLATTVNNIFILMAMHPEYQEKLYEEIKSLFPNRGDLDITYADIKKMEYMDMVINESMRLLPTIAIIGRQLSQDLHLSNGVELPKGINILISIYHMHRSKDIWGPEANIFNPQNCTQENLQSKHSYAFMPFSKGKRNCIGWKYALISMKVTLVKVLRNFRLSTSVCFEELVIVDHVTLKFQDIPIKLERRA